MRRPSTTTSGRVLYGLRHGEILHSNFPSEKTAYFQDCLKRMYAGITAFCNLGVLELA